MGYIYKLIDEKEKEASKNGMISLSHPIFEFKGSEGEIINFAKRIYDRYKKKGDSITPSKTDISEIRKWISTYKETFGPSFNDIDIHSESMIFFCVFMQHFCGYFTSVDLFDGKNLQSFLEKSKLSKKTYVLRIDDSILENASHWRTMNLEDPFTLLKKDPNNFQGYNGYTHLIKISYIENYKDYHELLSKYNSDAETLRSSTYWFDNLSKKYEWQQEKRILFNLESFKKNCLTIGLNQKYNQTHVPTDYANSVFGYIVDAIEYCINGPRYVYLSIDKKDMCVRSKEEILKL